MATTAETLRQFLIEHASTAPGSISASSDGAPCYVMHVEACPDAAIEAHTRAMNGALGTEEIFLSSKTFGGENIFHFVNIPVNTVDALVSEGYDCEQKATALLEDVQALYALSRTEGAKQQAWEKLFDTCTPDKKYRSEDFVGDPDHHEVMFDDGYFLATTSRSDDRATIVERVFGSGGVLAPKSLQPSRALDKRFDMTASLNEKFRPLLLQLGNQFAELDFVYEAKMDNFLLLPGFFDIRVRLNPDAAEALLQAQEDPEILGQFQNVMKEAIERPYRFAPTNFLSRLVDKRYAAPASPQRG